MVDYSANIIFGACIDENIRDEVEVTVIATGFAPVVEVRSGELSRSAQAQQQANAQVAQQRAVSEPQYAPPAVSSYEEHRPAPHNPYAAQQQAEPVYPASEPQYTPPAPPAPEEQEFDQPEGRRLPPFVQRLLGKKK